jgi:serine protease Do
MKSWKTAGLAAALVGAAGIGAALAPVAHGQNTRVITPRAVDVFSFGGGRIGVAVADLDPADAGAKSSGGVVIESVDEDSPAAKAGLRKGDIVVEFDGERVRSVRQFSRLVSETPVGRTVSAAVQRDGQRVTVSVAPRASEAARFFDGDLWRRQAEDARNFTYTIPKLARPESDARRDLQFLLRPGGAVLGITTDELSSQLAEYFGTKDGVLVSSVGADSVGAKTGLKAGDVITSVNGASVANAIELRRRLSRIEAGEEFTLGIVRDKKAMTLKGKVEPRTPARRSTARSIL